jgi:hypothetical protein
MAAGAILPPLFFERSASGAPQVPRMASSGTPEKHHPRNSTAGVISGPSATRSLPKEI